MPLRFKDKLEGTITNADYATNAGTASKIGKNAGGSTTPVYFANGVPVALGYTIQSSVPANAKFTDTNTTYNVFTGATASAAGSTGLVPAPTAGQNGYFLRGDRTWAALSKSTVGLGNVDNTADANKSVKAATTATNDAKDQAITGYIRGLSVSGRTITYTRGDGTTGSITTQDTNTTYGIFGKATADAAGSTGLVPAPAKGQQGLYLRGDGTWASPANTTYGNFKGATSSAAGGAGLVPAPGSNVLNQYLKSTGAWGQVAWGEISGKPSSYTPASHTHKYASGFSVSGTTVTVSYGDGTTSTFKTQDTNTTYGVFKAATASAAGGTGLVPAPAAGAQAKYLRGDGTWQTPPDNNTWRGIQDNLTSSSTSDSLSANQGKVLKGLVDGKAASNHTHKYASSFSVSGTTVTVTYGDSTTSTFKTQDTNTTYGTFKAATASAAGGTGLVPAPAAGAQGKYLRADGTWQTPPDTNTTYNVFKAATASAAGGTGLVPAPAAGSQAKYLRGDGTWQSLSKSTVGLSNVDNTADSAKSVKSAAKLQTYREGSTTETYGDSYPLYAQWSGNDVVLKCDNYRVKVNHAEYAGEINPNNSYGSITKAVRPMFDSVRANRLAFLPSDQIIVEKTVDGGKTWTDAAVTDYNKRALFSENGGGFTLPQIDGKKNTLCGIRLTITGMKYNVPAGTAETAKYNYWNSKYVKETERYCTIGDMFFWVSGGADNISLVIERATGGASTNWENLFESSNSTGYLNGWSGPNYIKFNEGTLGGGTGQTSNCWNYRFTFMSHPGNGSTFNSNYITQAQNVTMIKAYGASVWNSPNSLMSNDHMYTWDVDKNVAFPAIVYASGFNGAATKLARDGNLANPMTFNWSGKDGQPTWLWGGEDGGNMYVYNPSKFNVNSAKTATSADSAKKLTTNAGSATNPVYFSNGVPVATTYTLGKSVPSNAVFTDTHTLTLADRVSGKVVTCDAIPTT